MGGTAAVEKLGALPIEPWTFGCRAGRSLRSCSLQFSKAVSGAKFDQRHQLPQLLAAQASNLLFEQIYIHGAGSPQVEDSMNLVRNVRGGNNSMISGLSLPGASRYPEHYTRTFPCLRCDNRIERTVLLMQPGSAFTSPFLPALITRAGNPAPQCFPKFFTVHIRNPNTRSAYGHVAGSFLH